MKSPLDLARALLQKAANDLVAAQATLATGEALDTVCFHYPPNRQHVQPRRFIAT